MITIKGYQIIKQLGQGGMATVYLAKEKGLEREVALKILAIHIADETFKKSFLAEARLVAALEHQHIIKIYRIGIENDQFYMEMELLREGTLKERLEKERKEKTTLNLSFVLSIIKQIASALSYAHKQGYIHRDIKPANILFRNDDEVVLADFGIAKQENKDSDLTQAGHSGFGTPSYMAPEQAIGEKVDGRADMYSLGIVLYEMLAQEKPFQATNTIALINKHMTADIPRLPSKYAHFQAVLDKALSKDKEERYADVLDFSEELILADANGANANESSDDDATIAYSDPIQSTTHNEAPYENTPTDTKNRPISNTPIHPQQGNTSGHQFPPDKTREHSQYNDQYGDTRGYPPQDGTREYPHYDDQYGDTRRYSPQDGTREYPHYDDQYGDTRRPPQQGGTGAYQPYGNKNPQQDNHAHNETRGYTRQGYMRPWQIPNHKASEQLVISFIDVKGSTNMSEKMGDVGYEPIRKKFEDIIAENTADSNEAALVKMMGDGALIIYADAVYAIKKSLKIQKDVYRHSKQHNETKFSLRIGLHFGLVKLETTSKLDVHGAHVNKAARIEGCGQSGLVAMSSAVYDIVYPQLKHDIDFFWKDKGNQKLKGVAKKEKIYLVSSKKIPIDWRKYKFLSLLIIAGAAGSLLFAINQKNPGSLKETIYNLASETNIVTERPEDIATKIDTNDKKITEETEAKRLIEEAETKRVAEEAKAKRMAEEAKAKKMAEEAEAKAKRMAEEEAEAKRVAEEKKAKRIAEEEATKIDIQDILDQSFRRWKTLCEDYKVYRNYEGLLQINQQATGGGSRSKQRMELEGKQNDAEKVVIDSFARFAKELNKINNISDIDSQLENYMSNRTLSSFKKKRFAKAIKDEIVNADRSRSNRIEYYKTICR